MSSFVFLCIDTATTEIYTYSHTLSLPAALPIYRWRQSDPADPRDRRRRRDRGLEQGGRHRLQAHRRYHTRGRRARGPSWPVGLAARNPRSEEHTSELQSLMRISYAVFCLKKKTQLTENTTTR